ncbi:MAG: bifunctional metallophosphatase/5'-nucleotidase [Deltaproteobacteria bacterium]|nr:bifunctional metallophosphatase/5'-nucleotidase [Deltaproteobacteria bacterium]
MNRFKVLLPCFAVGLALAFAGCINKPVTIEILHFNDLHSNFDSGRTTDLGGYAAVKAQLDKMRSDAVARGHQTLVLDGGDSFEGSPYFMAGNGSESMRLLAAMGADATVIGNHDFLMGPTDFNRLVGEAPLGFKFVSGNIDFDARRYPALGQNLKRYVTFTKGGLRIAVIGLTTDSPFYRWAAGDVAIVSPFLRAQELVAKLRVQNDIIIVLSHLGTSDDTKLARMTTGIDLIVGAHDHVALPQPLIVKNLTGGKVPILQSAPFGEGIGQLTITINKDRTSAINGYQIVPVRGNVTGLRDAAVDQLVRNAAARLETQYGTSWLNEQLAISKSPLANDENAGTNLGGLTAQAFQDSAHTDIALDFGEFHGFTQPAGAISRRSLLKVYPRMFELKPLGWTLYTMELPGAVLQEALSLLASSSGFQFTVAGASYDLNVVNGSRTLSNLKIGGEAVDLVKIYTIAIPEALARGAVEIPKLYEGPLASVLTDISASGDRMIMGFVVKELSAFNTTIKDTGVPIWSILETRMRALKNF